MPTEKRPDWLIRQENGVISEARTRSFLVDRFWILERSADIEGVDFLVQRRLIGRSLLDRSAPPLGVIQAKFCASPKTTHYIHREYVLDPEGTPRSEFFLICHTGAEDAAQSYLLSASEIVANFKETDTNHSRPSCFALPGRALMIQRFAIVDRVRALDRIENTLRQADFDKNRRFLSWALPKGVDSRAPIQHTYEEPIDNWWGDIPKEFERLREGASRAQWDFSDVLEKLREIECSNDPEHALALGEELTNTWRGSVNFSHEIYNEEFHRVVLDHKHRYEQMEAAGLLGAHSSLRRTVFNFALGDLVPRMPLAPDIVYIFSVRYDQDTLLQVRCESRCEECAQVWPDPPVGFDSWIFKDIPGTVGTLNAAPGYVEGYIVAGRYYSKDDNTSDHELSYSERMGSIVDGAVGKLCEKILELRLGESWLWRAQ
jgi:hypothetical protein